MPFEITLEVDVSDVLLRLDRHHDRLVPDTALIMLEEVTEAVAISRNVLVPVDKGDLQASIGIIEWIPEALTLIAGATAAHAPFVEFGHYTRGRRSYVSARPFWRPPAWEAFYRIRERMVEQVKEYYR